MRLRRVAGNRGFTLIELAVVLIVIALIALIGIPTFQRFTEKAREKALGTEMLALARSANAIAAIDGRDEASQADIELAMAELSGAFAPGVTAAGPRWSASVSADTPGTASVLSVAVRADLPDVDSASAVGFAAVTGSGSCVFAATTHGSGKHWAVDAGTACTGLNALSGVGTSPSGDPGDGDPGDGDGEEPEVVLGAPVAPAGLSVTPGDVTFAVSWDAVGPTDEAPVSGYRVYVDDEKVFDGEATSYTSETLTPGVEYSFAVSAYGDGGESPRVSADSSIPIVPSGAVEDLVAAAGDRTMTLTWNPPAPIPGQPVTKYSVECLESPNWVVKKTVDAPATTATVTGLTPRVDATCRVGTFTTVAGAYSEVLAKPWTSEMAANTSVSRTEELRSPNGVFQMAFTSGGDLRLTNTVTGAFKKLTGNSLAARVQLMPTGVMWLYTSSTVVGNVGSAQSPTPGSVGVRLTDAGAIEMWKTPPLTLGWSVTI